MTWFRVGGAGVPVSLKNGMNAVLNKKFGTSGQNYPSNGWPDDVNLLGPLPEKTVAGAIAHTDDAADTVPVKSMICSIVPKQAGTGTPSSTNIRALSGYTGLTASQRSINMLDTANAETKTHNSVSITCDGAGKYTATGTATGGSANITFTLKTPLMIHNGMYLHLMNANANASVAITLQEQDNSTIYAPALSPANRIIDLSSYSGQTIYSIRFYIANGATFEMTLSPMICANSSTLTFEAYNAVSDVSDSWSSIGTIYGGERDLTLGTLKSKGFINVFDTVDGNVVESQYYNFNKINGNVAVLGNTVRITFNAKTATNVNRISSSYSFVGCNVAPHQFSYAADAEHFYINTVFYLFIDKTVCGETAPEVFDWLVSLINNGTPLQVYMEYSTATEYNNLSTYDFETLYAVNNFFSDIVAGQTQVTYRQDIALALAALQGSRSLSASLMRSAGPDLEERSENPEEVSEPEENIQNTEEQEGENDER